VPEDDDFTDVSEMNSAKPAERKLVIFDLDGTLVDSKFNAMNVRLAMIEHLRRSGLDTHGLTQDDYTEVFLGKMHKKFERVLDPSGLSQLRSDLLEIADRYERAAYEDSNLRAGAVEALRRLKESGNHLAVVTNNSRRTCMQTLDRFLLTEFFEVVVTRDDVAGMKPSPAGILRVISFFHAPKEDTYYVGDSMVDVMAAKAANVKVVILATASAWDGHPQPDYWAISLADVASLISADTDHR